MGQKVGVFHMWQIAFAIKHSWLSASDTPAYTQNHKPDQVPHTKNQMTVFHAGDGSNNVYPWKKQVKVAAAIVSVGGGEEREVCNTNSSFKQSQQDLNIVKICKVEGSRLGHPRIQRILGLHEQQQQRPKKTHKNLFSKSICVKNFFLFFN